MSSKCPEPSGEPETKYSFLLRQARDEKGLSQKALAKLLVVNPAEITRWEQGRAFPRPYLCQLLSENLGKTIEQLGLDHPPRQHGPREPHSRPLHEKHDQDSANAAQLAPNLLTTVLNTTNSIHCNDMVIVGEGSWLVGPSGTSVRRNTGSPSGEQREGDEPRRDPGGTDVQHEPSEMSEEAQARKASGPEPSPSTGTQKPPSPAGSASRHRRLLQYGLVALLMAIVLVVATPSLFQAQRAQSPGAIYTSAVGRHPDFHDALTSPNANNWDLGGSCGFAGKGYLVTSDQRTLVPICKAQAQSFRSDFVLDVQMTILQGDGGGIVFRDSQNGGAYRFHLSPDGSYDLFSNNAVGPDTHILASGRNVNAIKTGFGTTHSNTLGVVARGSTLSLFVNGTYLTSVTANAGDQSDVGRIGLFAVDFSNQTTVEFSNLDIWYL